MLLLVVGGGQAKQGGPEQHEADARGPDVGRGGAVLGTGDLRDLGVDARHPGAYPVAVGAGVLRIADVG